MSSGYLRVVLVLLGLGAGFPALPAADPRAEIRVYTASTDPKVAMQRTLPGRPWGLIQGGIVAGKDGVPEVRGLVLGYVSGLKLDDAFRPGSVFFPPLREGDLIPAYYGQVCTVGPVAVPKRGEPSTFVFVTAPDPPAGTALQPHGFAIPIKETKAHSGTLRTTETGHYTVWVDRVAVPPGGAPAAELTVQHGIAEKPHSATVRAGDVLFSTGIGYRIQAVVPKDPKTRVIGWVEFDPRPLAEDQAKGEAVKSGGKVVRPTAP